ncbi:hypothetical protein TNCV_2578801 [Trichonephila clavipes]|nr:hypothetical protein TNCV_2578801 [Trichonephila clavipes]
MTTSKLVTPSSNFHTMLKTHEMELMWNESPRWDKWKTRLDETLSHAHAFEWNKQFSGARDSGEDDEGDRCPSSGGSGKKQKSPKGTSENLVSEMLPAMERLRRQSTAALSYDYTACKSSLKCLLGLGTLGRGEGTTKEIHLRTRLWNSSTAIDPNVIPPNSQSIPRKLSSKFILSSYTNYFLPDATSPWQDRQRFGVPCNGSG